MRLRTKRVALAVLITLALIAFAVTAVNAAVAGVIIDELGAPEGTVVTPQLQQAWTWAAIGAGVLVAAGVGIVVVALRRATTTH